MSDDHDFMLLQKADFHDAGDEGLAIRLQTEPSPTTGRAYAIGFLLDPTRGMKLLEELTTALARKYPDEPW